MSGRNYNLPEFPLDQPEFIAVAIPPIEIDINWENIYEEDDMSMNSICEEMNEEDAILARLGKMKDHVLAGPESAGEITTCHMCGCDDLDITIGADKGRSRSTIKCKQCDFTVSGFYNEAQVTRIWNKQGD